MRGSRSCDDPEMFQKVKDAVSIQAVADHFGIKADRRGMCRCPFHDDRHPSLKLYPEGKGFFCFTCGVGGDQIRFAALYLKVKDAEAARILAEEFNVPLETPMTYREKREAALAAQRRRELARFTKWASAQLKMYWILLCEARRDPGGPHFEESLDNLDYVEYLMECLEECPKDVYQDRRTVRKIGEVAVRLTRWYDGDQALRAVSG